MIGEFIEIPARVTEVDDTIDRLYAQPTQPDIRILRARLKFDKQDGYLSQGALAALEKRLNPTERDRLLANNWEPSESETGDRAGVLWTEAEATSLAISFACGTSLNQLCMLHRRAAGGIVSRLERLKLVEMINGQYFNVQTKQPWLQGPQTVPGGQIPSMPQAQSSGAKVPPGFQHPSMPGPKAVY